MNIAARNGCWPAAIAAVLAVLLLAGCLEKHVIWSPDGGRAAVLANDGLHFCDPDGNLTPPLMPGVYQAAWFGDSQGLVIARQRKVADWASIAQALGPERAGKIAAEAEALWQRMETEGNWGLLSAESGLRKDRAALKIYIRKTHGDALRTKLSPGQWDEIKSKEADLNELMTVRRAGDQVQAVAVIHAGLEKIEDLRLAPGDKAVAFTTDIAPGDDDDSALLLARIDTAVSVKVAEHTAAYPDWAEDGRSLVYSQVSGGGSKDDLRLAILVRREVLDPDGRISIGKNDQQLAGFIFQNTTRVRCLRDGRILFNALEVTLPVAAKDLPDEHEKLFALDLERQATLVRMIPGEELDKMPKGLTFFEVSPDERRLLFGGVNGEVCVLTLATGDVQVWQDADKYGLLGAPVWRNNGEITYARRNPSMDGKIPSRRAEIVLRSTIQGSGNQEKVLSQGWSKEMLESVYSPTDRQ